MPYSEPLFDAKIMELLHLSAPKTVLDIGPGAGKYGRMIRGLAGEGLGLERLSAVEINPAYVEAFSLGQVYDEIAVGDAGNLPDIGPDAAWDLVILGDVLEHFRKSRGVDLLDYLYYRTKHILLVIPVDYIQGAWEGHAAEAHISVWRPEDFQRYRASIIVARTPEGAETLLVMINGLRARPGEDHMFS